MMMNYCRKCKREVPLGDACPFCSGKLSKTNERLSFWMGRVPVRDWFAWNQALRVALPVLGIVAGLVLLLEGALSGGRGIEALFLQGFFWTLVTALGAMLLVMLLVFWAQGPESVHFTLDKEGVHADTHLDRPTALRLYARFLSSQAVEKLAGEEGTVAGAALVRRAEIRWQDVRRVRCWRETRQLLFFRPSFWQVMVVTCPPALYPEAEAYVRKKLSRNKKARMIPGKP